MNVEHFSIFVFTAFLTSVMVSGAGSRALLFPVWSVSAKNADSPIQKVILMLGASTRLNLSAIVSQIIRFARDLLAAFALAQPNHIAVAFRVFCHDSKFSNALTNHVHARTGEFFVETAARLHRILAIVQLLRCANDFIAAITFAYPGIIVSLAARAADWYQFAESLTGQIFARLASSIFCRDTRAFFGAIWMRAFWM